MISRFVKSATLSLALVATTAFAQDVVTPTGPAQWNPWTTLNNIRGAGFWDGLSDDGKNCNIGYFLTGAAGPCNFWGSPTGSLTPQGNLLFLSALGSPTTPTRFSFTPGVSGHNATFLLTVTAANGLNPPFGTDEFGYYLLSNPANLFPLFTATQAIGSTAIFSVSQPFGYYLKFGNNVWLSSTNLNFAVFAQNPANPSVPPTALTQYLIGVEDKSLVGVATPFTGQNVGPDSNIDADYNDMVVSIKVVSGGCTLTQGGYKNHFNSKVVGLTLGTVSYTAAQINGILQNNAVKGNGLISLAHQLITAKLNALYGATVPSQVQTAISQADALIGSLIVPGSGLPKTGFLSPSATSSIEGVLDAYNNGKLGPLHCTE